MRLIDLASRFCSGVCADGWLFKKNPHVGREEAMTAGVNDGEVTSTACLTAMRSFLASQLN